MIMGLDGKIQSQLKQEQVSKVAAVFFPYASSVLASKLHDQRQNRKSTQVMKEVRWKHLSDTKPIEMNARIHSSLLDSRKYPKERNSQNFP
jgi:hypothetical protein